MRSRGLPGSDEAASRSAWVRKVVIGGLGTAGATIALAAFAASAFANAANPLPKSTGTISPAGGGAVRVDVSGMWNWGELSGSSVQSDCGGRYGVGWSVDWWGMGSNKDATSFPDGNLQGSIVNWSGKGAPVLGSGTILPAGSLKISGTNTYFHTSSLYNGFDADLCDPPDSLDANHFPQGPWGSPDATYAIYPSIGDVPHQLCVNFYDPHGKLNQPSTNSKDYDAVNNDDNSISKNAFNPAANVGYCFTPTFQHPLSINLAKTNDANQDGTFTQTETAKVAGQTVQFSVTIQNTSTTAVTDIDNSVDVFPGNAGLAVCNGTTSGDKTQDSGWSRTTLGLKGSATDSATCTFTLANYAPSATDKTNTVTVNVHEDGLPDNKLSKDASSTVKAPNPNPTLEAHIRLCSTGALIGGGSLVGSGPAGATLPNGAADFPQTSEPPGNYTMTAAAPNGYVLVNCPAHNFTKTNTLTATLGNSGNTALNFYVAPAPGLHVTKDGPVSGVVGGTGDYTITVTNTSNQADVGGPIVFYDQLPTGESYLSAHQVNANGTATNPNQITCATVPGNASLVKCTYPNDLTAGESIHVDVTIQWADNVQGQALTDCAGTTPQNAQPGVAANDACVTTHFPELGVQKSGPATGVLNGNGTYTLLVTNNTAVASTATTVTDTLPDGETFVPAQSSAACSANGRVVTCSVPALAGHGSTTFTVTVTYTKTGHLTDCATIDGQPVPSCRSTDVFQPSISVVKTNDADGDGIFHDTEAAKQAGDAVTFKVVVTNTSKVTIVLDTVSDAFDATTLAECPQLTNPAVVLASGDSVTCTFTVDNYAPAAGTSLTDTVTVTGHEPTGGTPVSGSDTSTVKTRNPQQPGPDLAILKTADKDKVKAGDALTYTLSVSNVGAGPTTGAVTVTDTIPSGLDPVSVDGGSAWDCALSGRDVSCVYNGGAVQPGVTLPDITIVTTVNDTAVAQVVNTGVVSTPGDTNPLNDRSTVKTPVTTVLPEKIVKPTTPTQVLPFTGDRTGQMLPIGLAAVLLGLMLVVTGRRRRTT